MTKPWAEKSTIASLARTRLHTNAGSDKGKSGSPLVRFCRRMRGWTASEVVVVFSPIHRSGVSRGPDAQAGPAEGALKFNFKLRCFYLYCLKY